MNLLRISDIGDGRIQVHWRRGDEERSYTKPIPFADPLTAKDRAELRWYLEEYLDFPYGAERNRAEKVEARMNEWGESLFTQVFIKTEEDPDPRAFYQEALREGLEQCELCITSEDPEFLNIPWELIRDPTPGRGFLSTSLAGLYRQRVGQRIEAPMKLPTDEPFRILLVISRPFGEPDVPLGTVARPMLQALRPLRPQVHLEVLRPPTFDELVRRLSQRRGYYHLVHFDGHGVFSRSSASPITSFAAMAGRGHLVFEREDGSPYEVNSQELGQALATCHVPLFVLNACQSAEEGASDPFSSVAAQLVAVGAKGVVAMSYSVYASAAAHFMGRFYEKLVEHAPLSEAVAAARQDLQTKPERDSAIGSIKLRDWMVPTLYQQERGYVPIPEGAGVPVSGEKEIEQLKQAEERCPEGQFGFIGRDYDILRMERALRDDDVPWALISGIGGTGKTEFAFGFARWYAETGGCPGGVFMASFKEKADFGQVIGSIVGYGTEFSRMSEEQQWQFLVEYLRENACLLIWDNFEPVNGYPQGAEPLATDEEREKLSRFLKQLRGGKSRVIITTRKPDETWLGIAYQMMELAGLTHRDAGQMARVILRTVGRRPEDFKDDRDYARLIRLLGGHPRSLEVVLLHLRRNSPAQIIEALQHRVDDLGEAMEDASLAYAFSQMSERTRKHLPFIGLFASYVHAGALGDFGKADSEWWQVYESVMGEALDAAGWEAVLEEAARGGLLQSLGSRMYKLHPTLPAFLRRQLVLAVGEDGLKRLDSEFTKFYSAWTSVYFESTQKGEQNAVAAVSFEEANLLRALRLAEVGEEWSTAQAIAQTLGEFYEVCSRMDEWDALRRRLLDAVGRRIPPDASRGRADLWMYLLGNEANRAIGRNRLKAAENVCQRILRYLLSLSDPEVDRKIATVYHQLGMIAQRRSDFDGAEEWHRKALEIFQRLGLERYVAIEYHHLGMVAQERNDFDHAEKWYRKTLKIFERLGLERDAANVYNQLGVMAQKCRDFDHAEEWHREAVEIRERLGLKRDVATDYSNLGMLAAHRGRFDQAEERYRKALEIYERIGHPPLMVNTLALFGLLRRQQKRFLEAVSWSGKAYAIITEYRMPVIGKILTQLAWIMMDMGEEEFAAAWREAFPGEEAPVEAIRKIMESQENHGGTESQR